MEKEGDRTLSGNIITDKTSHKNKCALVLKICKNSKVCKFLAKFAHAFKYNLLLIFAKTPNTCNTCIQNLHKLPKHVIYTQNMQLPTFATCTQNLYVLPKYVPYIENQQKKISKNPLDLIPLLPSDLAIVTGSRPSHSVAAIQFLFDVYMTLKSKQSLKIC